VHKENMEKDAELAHVAAGGAAKEKGIELEREPTKGEAFLAKFNASWFGQLSMVKGEY